VTNEELAVQIQQGNKELCAELWGQVQRFIVMKARGYHAAAVQARGHANGCEVDDLIQAGYLGMLDAVRYFDASKEWKFLSYLKMLLRSHFAEATGVRRPKQQHDALNISLPLDKPMSDGGGTFLDALSSVLISGEDNLEDSVCEVVYLQQLHGALEQCIAELPERQQVVVRQRYYEGRTLEAIAEEHGCTRANIQQHERRALFNLYQNRDINGLSQFVERHTNYHIRVGFESFSSSWTSAVEKIVLKREQLAEGWMHKRLKSRRKSAGTLSCGTNSSKGSNIGEESI